MAEHDAGVPLPPVADPGQPAPGARTAADPGLLAADVALLREGGYLKLAVPVRLGGAGLNLRQVASRAAPARGTDAGRRVRRERPPRLDRGRSRHAGQRRAGRSGGRRLLREAAQGGFIAGWPGRPRNRVRAGRARSPGGRSAGLGLGRYAGHRRQPGRGGRPGIRLHPPPGQPRASARHAARAAGGRAGRRDVQLGAAAGGHDVVCHRPAGVRAGRAAGAATAGRWRRAGAAGTNPGIRWTSGR